MYSYITYPPIVRNHPISALDLGLDVGLQLGDVAPPDGLPVVPVGELGPVTPEQEPVEVELELGLPPADVLDRLGYR